MVVCAWRIFRTSTIVLKVDVTGSAGVNLEATFTTPIGSAIRYGGDWVWDLAQLSGYTLDASTSGFDSQELLDSLVTSMASGIEYPRYASRCSFIGIGSGSHRRRSLAVDRVGYSGAAGWTGDWKGMLVKSRTI